MLFSILENRLSRRNEYESDQYAARLGYKDAFISGLKRMTIINMDYFNLNPLLVKLFFTHPTVSQRIAKLEELN